MRSSASARKRWCWRAGSASFHGETEQAVKRYLSSVNPQGKSGEAHVLYQHEGEGRPGRAFITCIECLTSDLEPKPDVYTWDDFVLRVHYTAERDFEQGEMIIDIRDYKQQRLAVLDSGQKMPIRRGGALRGVPGECGCR